MSPEQTVGLPLDGSSDVFVAGILLWEMFFGAPPLFAPHEIAAHVPSGAMPRSVEVALMRMLEPGPKDRCSATAALDAIIACADYPKNGRDALAVILRERFPHRVPGLGRPVPTEETPELMRPLPLDEHPQIVHRMIRMRRNRRRKAFLAAITVAGALSFSVYKLGSRTAAELEQPVLDLPSTAEPLAPGVVRLAAPERAPEPSATELAPPRLREALVPELAPRLRERAPASPQQVERKPPEDAPTARPEAPPDFRVIELPLEGSKPGRTGEDPWIQP